MSDSIEHFQKVLEQELFPYQGKLVSVIKQQLLPNSQGENKASFAKLACKMLNVSSNQVPIEGTDTTAVIKTIRVTGDGKPAESMSFMNVKFDEWLADTEWENSSLYHYFYEKPLILFVFQQFPSGKRVPDSQMTFRGIKVWKMPNYDLNHGVKDIWVEVRRLINDGKLKITQKPQKNGKLVNKNNLPGIKFNGIAHLRSGGANGADMISLPTGQQIAKQRFWLNSDYIEEALED